MITKIFGVKTEKKKKVWKDSTAVAKFNAFIVKKYGRCLRCGRKEYLQCSHYNSANISSMRFNEKNCICLCYPCHYGRLDGWEYHKHCEHKNCYRNFMIKHLGEEEFKKLEVEAHTSMPRKDAIIKLMSWLGK